MTNLEILTAAIKLHSGTDSNQFHAIVEDLAQYIDSTEKQKQNTATYTQALPQPCTMAK